MNRCDSLSRFGWYRFGDLKNTSKTLDIHIPEGPHNIDIFRDGKPLECIRYDGDSDSIHSIKIGTSCEHLTFLVQSLGGSSIGNNQIEPNGIHEPIDVLERFDDHVHSHESDVAPVNPFDVRPFILECTEGVSSPSAHSWTFTHRRKKPLRIAPGSPISGTWLLNGQILTRSESGSCRTFVISPTETDSFKSGKNLLVFRPDSGKEHLGAGLKKSLKMWEIVDTLGTKSKSLAFATNRIPDDVLHSYEQIKGSRRQKTPTWYRSNIETALGGSLVVDLSSMSRGVVHLNGDMLGIYDSSDEAVVCLPGGRTNPGDVLDIFDVEGSDPGSISIVNRSF